MLGDVREGGKQLVYARVAQLKNDDVADKRINPCNVAMDGLFRLVQGEARNAFTHLYIVICEKPSSKRSAHRPPVESENHPSNMFEPCGMTPGR